MCSLFHPAAGLTHEQKQLATSVGNGYIMRYSGTRQHEEFCS